MIKTERLEIRRVRLDDWKEIQQIELAVDQTEYAQYDRPKSTSDQEVYQWVWRWALLQFSMEHMFFGVLLDGEMIGYISCNRRPNGYEIGYAFHTDYWGNGYAKESIGALIQALNGQGVDHFEAGTALNNTPSVKLLQSLGFKQTGAEKVSFYKDEDGHPIYFDGGIFELSF